MNKLWLLALTATLIFPTPSQSNTNHFGARGVFELDLGDREIALMPKQDKIYLSKNKIDVIQVKTTHIGKVTLGIGEGKRPDYKAMEKALTPSFVHGYAQPFWSLFSKIGINQQL